MTEAVRGIYTFLSGFGVPVYDENSVPEDAVFPYMTYNPIITDWDGSALMQVRLWDYPGPDHSAGRIYGIVDQIGESIDSESKILPVGTHKYVTLAKGEPWVQPQPTPDVKARVIILNFEISTLI